MTRLEALCVAHNEYMKFVCRTCLMPDEPNSLVDHPTIYGCLAALGKEISRLKLLTAEPSYGDDE